jgi:hypothetical protein
MSSQEKPELARENMSQAEMALTHSLRSSVYGPEEQRRLADAVKVASDEFLKQVSALGPV